MTTWPAIPVPWKSAMLLPNWDVVGHMHFGYDQVPCSRSGSRPAAFGATADRGVLADDVVDNRGWVELRSPLNFGILRIVADHGAHVDPVVLADRRPNLQSQHAADLGPVVDLHVFPDNTVRSDFHVDSKLCSRRHRVPSDALWRASGMTLLRSEDSSLSNSIGSSSPFLISKTATLSPFPTNMIFRISG